MKVALVCPRFYPTAGGAERYTYNLARRLPEHGWEVVVLTSDKNYKHRSWTKLDDFWVIYVPSRQVLGYGIPRLSTLALLRDVDPCLVHTNGPYPYSDAFAFMAKVLGKPCIMTHHAPLNPPSVVKKFLAWMERMAMRFLYDWVIVTSHLNYWRLRGVFPLNRVHVIPLGVDDVFMHASIDKGRARESIGVGDDDKILLFVGRLDRAHYYKGLSLLLEALRFLESEVRLWVVGTGELKSQYEKLALRYGVSERVKFLGFVPDTELAVYYAASDLLVLPSLSESEGFGLVLLEAMCLGTPTMTTDKPGSANLLARRKASFILRSLHPREMAKQISIALRDEALRREVVDNARRFVRMFNWEKTAQKTAQLYKTVCC